MRYLVMDDFANDLPVFVERLIDYKLLLESAESYNRPLRVLQPSDPLIFEVAKRTARQIVTQMLWITDADSSNLAKSFPHFARMIDKAVTKGAVLWNGDREHRVALSLWK